MNTKLVNIAIIPARGGSKRIPRKNISSFRGKPMMAWSIEAALQSTIFDIVMVSTDDPEISAIAKSFGAEVPFRRSDQASDDYATTADVIKEVLAAYSCLGTVFENACCVYPTAPFVVASDLQEGYEQLKKSDFDVIMPITAFSYPVWRSLKSDERGRVSMNFPEHLQSRSQDLTPAYHDAGQWYWFRIQPFLKHGTLIAENTGSVELSELRVQDIDTPEDWILAEIKHERYFDQSIS